MNEDISDALSLEKLKINDRLHSVELQMARVVAHLESEVGTFERFTSSINKNLDSLHEIISRHDEILLGKGADVASGIIIRTDRLEVAHKDREKHFWVIWTSMAGIFVKFFYDLIKKVQGG